MFAELLRKKLAGICELPAARAEQMQRHCDLLVRWNRVINLTSVRSVEDVVERHYCESVFAAIHLPAGVLRIGDVGSGGGFPGVPLAIMRPDCHVALIESHQRKGAFLREAVRDLPNVRVLTARAEDVQEEFDWVLSRAVKYADIAEDLRRLGRSAELLTGACRVEDLPGFVWQRPIALPWGDHRSLWIGARSTL